MNKVVQAMSSIHGVSLPTNAVSQTEEPVTGTSKAETGSEQPVANKLPSTAASDTSAVGEAIRSTLRELAQTMDKRNQLLQTLPANIKEQVQALLLQSAASQNLLSQGLFAAVNLQKQTAQQLLEMAFALETAAELPELTGESATILESVTQKLGTGNASQIAKQLVSLARQLVDLPIAPKAVSTSGQSSGLPKDGNTQTLPNAQVTAGQMAGVKNAVPLPGMTNPFNPVLSTQPGTTAPGELGTAVPGQPGTAAPSQPGTAAPSQPGTAVPGQPGTVTPGQPGAAMPGQSGTVTPGQPGTAAPGQSSTVTPGQPGTAAPGQSVTTAPGQPGAAAPSQPGTATPVRPGMITPGQAGTIVPGQSSTSIPGQSGVAVPLEQSGMPVSEQPAGAVSGQPGVATSGQSESGRTFPSQQNKAIVANWLNSASIQAGQQSDGAEMVTIKQLLANLAAEVPKDQMAKLTKSVESLMPQILKQAAAEQGLAELPNLWALLKMVELDQWKAIDRNERAKAGVALRRLAQLFAKEAVPQGENLNTHTVLSYSLPLYFGDNPTPYPAYIHIYHQREQEDRGQGEYETWLRIALDTENIGVVDTSFRLYDGEKVDVRVGLGDYQAVQSFTQSVPDIRTALAESPLTLSVLAVSKLKDE
jgi:hypothetical protein